MNEIGCVLFLDVRFCIVFAQILKCALFVYTRGCSQSFKDSEFPLTRFEAYFYLILGFSFLVNLHLIENIEIYYFIKTVTSIYSKLKRIFIRLNLW